MLEVFASSLLVSVNFLFRNIAAFDSEAADHSHRPPRDQRRRALQRSVRRSVPGILIPRYRLIDLTWSDVFSLTLDTVVGLPHLPTRQVRYLS